MLSSSLPGCCSMINEIGIPCYGPQPDVLDASGITWYRTDRNVFATLTSSQLTVLRGPVVISGSWVCCSLCMLYTPRNSGNAFGRRGGSCENHRAPLLLWRSKFASRFCSLGRRHGCSGGSFLVRYSHVHHFSYMKSPMLVGFVRSVGHHLVII